MVEESAASSSTYRILANDRVKREAEQAEPGSFCEINGPYFWDMNTEFLLLGQRLDMVRTTCIARLRKVLTRSAQPRELVHSLSESRTNRWSYVEEVLLIGAVFVLLAERGSLFPAERSEDGHTKQCESETFRRVYLLFEESKRMTGMQTLPPRTEKAVARHFKHMKFKYITRRPTHPQEIAPGFLKLIDDWMLMYGKGFLLDASDCTLLDFANGRATWRVEEDMILVGAVFQRFFTKGSLCTRGGASIACWAEIAELYQQAWHHLNLVQPVQRSGDALEKRYRDLKKNRGTGLNGRGSGLKAHIRTYLAYTTGFSLGRGDRR